MTFINGEPFTATKKHTEAPWSGNSANFRCAWCGHRFKIGDTVRWVYTNVGSAETKGIAGNPFICTACDGPRDVILARLRQMAEEFRSDRFWWFQRR